MHVPDDHPYTAGISGFVRINVVNAPQEGKKVPISSMTGFASISGQTGDSDWRWDVKSVNARGLDLRFRLPTGYEALEPKLRAAVQKVFKRGSIAISLTTRIQGAVGRTSLDESILAITLERISLVRARMDAAGMPVAPASAEAVLSLPGIIVNAEGEDVADPAAMTAEIFVGFEAALQALLRERDAEGVRLAHVLSDQVTQIESLTKDAAACADEAVIALRDRFSVQLKALLADTTLSPERLEQEAAILASKADVREEIDRLHAHVAAARTLLLMDEPLGRRLDFLTQEFNREANTLCSKSSTDTLTRIGLDLKTTIDQIKEQAANVE
jgi:uncharacterized protein (TIGR00255 family)